MEEQADVNEVVETTTEMESSPVENSEVSPELESADTQQSPADASVEPEKRVSETVPYDRFAEVNREKRELEERLKAITTPAPYQQDSLANEMPQLDPESEQAVRNTARQEWEAMKEADFKRKHAKDLADPLVAATTSHLIKSANMNGQYLDQEEALSLAKEMISQRTAPQVKQATEQGIQEGQQLARKKLESSAIGTTSVASPKLDDSQLTAEQLRQKYNVPRDTEIR